MNNQHWLMNERPNGMVSEQHFTLTETETPALGWRLKARLGLEPQSEEKS